MITWAVALAASAKAFVTPANGISGVGHRAMPHDPHGGSYTVIDTSKGVYMCARLLHLRSHCEGFEFIDDDTYNAQMRESGIEKEGLDDTLRESSIGDSQQKLVSSASVDFGFVDYVADYGLALADAREETEVEVDIKALDLKNGRFPLSENKGPRTDITFEGQDRIAVKAP